MLRQSKYSERTISVAIEMRARNVTWTEIAKALKTSKSKIISAVFQRTGPTGTFMADGMPRQLKEWPPVDFTPDELEVHDAR